MKKLLYILFLIPLLSFGQQIPISNSTATVCAGTFVDTGGAAANYNNNQNITFTICPATAGDVTRVNFSFFETELNNDVLSVFEGATNNPAFLIGTYSGTNSPGNILGDLAIDGGCLTFNFISNVVLNSPGWEADISCTPPCQTVNAIFDSADPPVDPVENVILACPNESITFNGSGTFSNPGGDVGATYEWFFSDATSLVGQTVLKTFTAGGFYEADLVVTDSFGCESTNDIGVFLQIGTEPDFTGTAAEMDPICLGDSVVITGMVEPVPFEVNCTIPVAEITFLPDDNGTTFYETCIPVDCFNAGETVQNASDILEICLNLEHSYLGDLDIFIIAPDGNQVTLKSFGAGGGGTFLGSPIEPDTDLTAGTGFDYCFGAAGTVTLVNGPQVAVDSGPPSNTTGNAIAAGNYLPEQDFSALIGSPLNGDWCIRVVDNLSSDNGYIFSWLLNFDPDIIPADAAFEPVITSEAWDPDPTTLNVVGNSILVQPTVVGQKCYTYRVMDDFGCEHTQEVCIDVLPTPIANEPNDLLICDDGTSAGTFNLSQNDAVVLGAQNPADFVISYYNSQADADAGMPAIAGSGAYGITGTSEFIFIRIEDASGLCYETAEFEIQFLPIDIVNPITDLLLCDADADGFVLVNIPQQKDTEILNGQDPNDYTLTYHNTIGDANADMNALPVPYNATAPGQVVFVRIENNTQNIGTCFLVDSFDLGIFQAPPANQPTLFAICDEVPNDGLAVFNLTTKDAEITGGNPDAEVFYFETLLNAQTNMVPINPANNYQNTIAGFQTLFARVQNINNAACFNIVTLDLQVDVAPIIADPITDFFQCDNDEDFVETFDLTLKDDEIENGCIYYILRHPCRC
jgi:subtilisin-like proprotein convertase family protein